MVQRINFNQLTNLGLVADPALPQDAASKNYVDTRGPAGSTTLQGLTDVSIVEPVFAQVGSSVVVSISAGTTSITVTSSAGIAVGDWLRGGTVMPGQVPALQVISIAGNLLEFNSDPTPFFAVGNFVYRLPATLEGARLSFSNAQNKWISSASLNFLPMDTISWVSLAGDPYVSVPGSPIVVAPVTTNVSDLANPWTFGIATLGNFPSPSEVCGVDALGRQVTGQYTSAAQAGTPTAVLESIKFDRVSGGSFVINNTYPLTWRAGIYALPDYVRFNTTTNAITQGQAAVDLRTATLIGANNTGTSGNYVNGNIGSVTTGFGNAGTTWQALQTLAGYTAAVAAITATGATPPAVQPGNWTLPAYPLYISNLANPTATQFATIAAIATNPTNNLLVITFSGNPSYFANAGVSSQPLFTQIGKFTFVPPPQTEIIRLAQANNVNSLNTLQGAVTLAAGTGIGIATGGQTITVTNTQAGVSTSNFTTFINDQFPTPISFVSTSIGTGYANEAYIGMGFETFTEADSGGLIGNTRYVSTPITAPVAPGNGLIWPIATNYTDIEVIFFSPAFSVTFTTNNASSPGDFVLEGVLFSKKTSNAATPPILAGQIFPGFQEAGSDDVRMVSLIKPVVTITGSGTSFTVTASAGQFSAVANGYTHTDIATEYISWFRIYNNNAADNIATIATPTLNSIGGVRVLVALPGVGGAQSPLQTVLNTGNSATNASPNIGSILLTDSVSAKTTTLDGTRVKAQSLVLDGSTSGSLTLKTAATTVSYPLTLPGAQATVAGQILANSGTGILSWVTPPTTSTVVQIAAISTVNITPSGAQTVDGYTVLDGDYILLTAQTDATTQGLYIASTTGAWTKQVTIVFQSVFSLNGTANGRKQYSRTSATPNELWIVTAISSAGGSQNLQSVVNLGNSITNSGTNVGSILIADATTLKVTTLDGTRVKSQSIVYDGATLGSLTMKAAGTTTSYSLTLPPAQATVAGQLLSNDGTGILSWAAGADSLQTVLNTGNTATNTGANRSSILLTDSVSVKTTTLDGTQVASQKLVLNGSTSGTTTIIAAATTTSYQLTMPPVAPTVGRGLISDATGSLSWQFVFARQIRAISLVDITPSGAQTVDGVAVVTNDAVLLVNQTDPTLSGVYQVVTTGAWVRQGTFIFQSVFAINGTLNSGRTYSRASDGLIPGNELWILTAINAATGSATNLQAVLNAGNTATNTSGNRSSILLTDSASAKTTTLDGTQLSSQKLVLNGSSIGGISFLPNANSGTYTLTYPQNVGSSGQGLVTDNNGNLSWQAVLGSRQIQAVSLVDITPSGAQTVDGVIVATNDIVLLANQTNVSQTGLYLVNTVTTWTRLTSYVYESAFALLGTLNIGRTYSRLVDGPTVGQELWQLTAINSVGATPTLQQVTTAGANTQVGIGYQSSGTTAILLKAPATLATSYQLTLPNAQATAAGQTLSNDGTGILSWITPVSAGARQIAVIATVNVVATSSQTVDGYAVQSGDYVLLTAQTDPIAPTGLYIAQGGAWARQTTIVFQSVFSLNGTSNGRRQYSRTAAVTETWILSAITAGGGTGTPGGLDTQFQYNNAGQFGGTPALTYDATNLRVSALAPVVATNIARLADVQAASAGLVPRNIVGTPLHVSEINVTGVYVNNTGIGTATFTGSGLLTISGATPTIGQEVLLVAQTAGLQNGSYFVTANSAAGFMLTRTNVAPAFGNFWVGNNQTSLNYGAQYENVTVGVITVGTTVLTYAQFGVPNAVGSIPNLQQVTTTGNQTTTGIQLGGNLQIGWTALNTSNTVLVVGSQAAGTPIISTSGVDTVIPLRIQTQGNAPVTIDDELRLGPSATDYLSLATVQIGRIGAGNLTINAGTNSLNQLILGNGAATTVNRVAISSGIATVGPTIAATGSANSSISLAGAGTGSVFLGTNYLEAFQFTGSNSITTPPVIAAIGSGPTSLRLLAEDTGGIIMSNGGANSVIISGGVTGSAPTIAPVGETNAGLNIAAAGTGTLTLSSNTQVNIGSNTNFIRISPTSGTLSPILASTGSTNIGLTIAASGTGIINLGTNQPNYIRITPAATGVAPIIAVVGDVNAGLSIAGSGTGAVNLGTNQANSIRITPAVLASPVNISAVGDANASLVVAPSGTGSMSLGNAAYSGFTVVGGVTSYSNLLAYGTAANLDLVLTPKGTGNLYPLGASLSAAGANQPKIIVATSAGSTTLGSGAQGQVMTSNGGAGSPYWATVPSGFQGANKSIYTAGGVYTVGSAVLPLTAQRNSLGLILSSNQLSGFATNALYEIVQTFSLSPNSAVTANTYWSVSTTNAITTLVAFGNGSAVSNNRSQDEPSGDYTVNSTTAYYLTGDASGTLFSWYFVGGTFTVSGSVLTITRIA